MTGKCNGPGHRSSVATPTPISRATASTVVLSGGSNRATALSLNSCPYRATSFSHHRPQVSDSIGATTSLTRGDHPYELFLQLEGIEHRTTRVRRPQSNGFVERLHRTLLDEHFRIAGRTKWYEAVTEMQGDLDLYLAYYNNERPHQGRLMEGRTPAEMFIRGISATTPSTKNDEAIKLTKGASKILIFPKPALIKSTT